MVLGLSLCSFSVPSNIDANEKWPAATTGPGRLNEIITWLLSGLCRRLCCGKSYFYAHILTRCGGFFVCEIKFLFVSTPQCSVKTFNFFLQLSYTHCDCQILTPIDKALWFESRIKQVFLLFVCISKIMIWMVQNQHKPLIKLSHVNCSFISVAWRRDDVDGFHKNIMTARERVFTLFAENIPAT